MADSDFDTNFVLDTRSRVGFPLHHSVTVQGGGQYMSQSKRVLLALTFGVGLIVAPAPASAQAVTGTLLGNVTDTSGAAVPGVTVTALEVATGISRTAVSNEAGSYS